MTIFCECGNFKAILVAYWGKADVCSWSAEEEIGFVPHALTTFVTNFAAITGV